MWPEIKDSEPGQEKFSVSGLEMEEVAVGPRTTSENYSQVEQGSRGVGCCSSPQRLCSQSRRPAGQNTCFRLLILPS